MLKKVEFMHKRAQVNTAVFCRWSWQVGPVRIVLKTSTFFSPSSCKIKVSLKRKLVKLQGNSLGALDKLKAVTVSRK